MKVTKTKAQELGITEFPFIVKNSMGKEIYYENSNSFWCKNEYDSNGKETYCEYSDGFWCKSEYDSNGNEIYYEDSDSFWCKREFDSNGNVIYYENSNGNVIYYENSNRNITDNRPKVVEMTMEEVCKALDKNVKIIK